VAVCNRTELVLVDRALSSCKPHVLAMSISVLWFIGDGHTCGSHSRVDSTGTPSSHCVV